MPTLDEISKAIDGRKLPPVHKWNPPLCGVIDIRIARDGTWYYLGTPIGRKRMVRLFSSVLRKDDGTYYLVTPTEKLEIKVDDAPFVAVELAVDGKGKNQTLSFRTQVDDWVVAGPAHPIRVETNPETGEPSPTLVVRDKLEALIARSVFYELVERAEISGPQKTFGVWSGGQYFSLGVAGK